MLTDANGEERKGIEVFSDFEEPYRLLYPDAGDTFFVAYMDREVEWEFGSVYFSTIRDLMLAGF